MLNPQRLTQLTIELIFALLGLLMIWLGLSRRIFFDRHGIAWLLLSIGLILWGVRAVYKPGQWWARWQIWTRGLSLILLGMVMLGIARAPFLWVGKLLALAGLVLIARGVIAAALLLRLR
jgi:hypothetical protein